MSVNLGEVKKEIEKGNIFAAAEARFKQVAEDDGAEPSAICIVQSRDGTHLMAKADIMDMLQAVSNIISSICKQGPGAKAATEAAVAEILAEIKKDEEA